MRIKYEGRMLSVKEFMAALIEHAKSMAEVGSGPDSDSAKLYKLGMANAMLLFGLSYASDELPTDADKPAA